MAEKELKEKLKLLEKQIAEAEAEENETYLNYLVRIREQTIHVYAGGQVFINSGTPPPPPPYGGG
jgi:hypothetical protein